jgi:hypothetical protein
MLHDVLSQLLQRRDERLDPLDLRLVTAKASE